MEEFMKLHELSQSLEGASIHDFHQPVTLSQQSAHNFNNSLLYNEGYKQLKVQKTIVAQDPDEQFVTVDLNGRLQSV